MISDTIADILTRIRNADLRGRETVRLPATRFTKALAKILLQEGFIENVRKHKEGMNIFLVFTLPYKRKREGTYRPSFNLKRISTPSVPVYCKYTKIPIILGGMGIVLLSTCRGLMTDREARVEKIGGKILCYIW